MHKLVGERRKCAEHLPQNWSEIFQVDVLRHAENNPPAFTNH